MANSVRQMSPDEAARLVRRRDYFDPPTELDRLAASAKWFFGTAATVGTVAAGLNLLGAGRITGAGQAMFAVVLVAVGSALALATLSLTPRLSTFNPSDDDALLQALSDVVTYRARLLRIAGALFGLAFVGAGAVQVVSLAQGFREQHRTRALQVRDSVTTPAEVVTFSLSDAGTLQVHYAAAAPEPHAQLAFTLEACPHQGMVGDPNLAARASPKDSTNLVSGAAGRNGAHRVLLPKALVLSHSMTVASGRRVDGVDTTFSVRDIGAIGIAGQGQDIVVIRRWITPPEKAASGSQRQLLDRQPQLSGPCEPASGRISPFEVLRIPIP